VNILVLSVSKQTQQIKTTFMKQRRADLNRGMLEIILWRILYLPVWYPKI
jgi:hypothetical protein